MAPDSHGHTPSGNMSHERRHPQASMPTHQQMPSSPSLLALSPSAYDEIWSSRDYFSMIPTTTPSPLITFHDQDDSSLNTSSSSSSICTPPIASAGMYSTNPTSEETLQPFSGKGKAREPLAHRDASFSSHMNSRHLASRSLRGTQQVTRSHSTPHQPHFRPYPPRAHYPFGATKPTTPQVPTSKPLFPSITGTPPFNTFTSTNSSHMHPSTSREISSSASPARLSDSHSRREIHHPAASDSEQQLAGQYIFHPPTAQRQPQGPTAPSSVPLAMQARASLLGNPLGSGLARDAMLAYAHRLYDEPNNALPFPYPPFQNPETNPKSPQHVYTTRLLPLLLSLRASNPKHLPTLLLLGCVLYAIGDYNGSLSTNHSILSIDPNYVEAMSNLGTTLKALGQGAEAETWWNRAVMLQPTYWDAIDNLMGTLCGDFRAQHVSGTKHKAPRYPEALALCEYVLSRISHPDGRIAIDFPVEQLFRLQNLLYTTGNLRQIVRGSSSSPQPDMHCQALELLLQMPPNVTLPHSDRSTILGYDVRDLIVTTCVAALLISGTPGSAALDEISQALGVENVGLLVAAVRDSQIDILRTVHFAGTRLDEVLLRIGSGVLPIPMLTPEQALQLPNIVFAGSSGTLPAICSSTDVDAPLQAPAEFTVKNTNRMTSAVLLALSKRFQEAMNASEPVLPCRDRSGPPIRPSLGLVLLFYYLSLALHPLASTYNNMGILLATAPGTTMNRDSLGRQITIDGPGLAQAFYIGGLTGDPQNPHLLTNLASLLKDQGKIEEAIQIYAKAVEHKPDFDVALANLANSVKDMGRISESVTYYKRAIGANPTFSEAICGLVNALGGICNWKGRGGVLPGPFVGNDGRLIPYLADITSEEERARLIGGSWMGKIIAICDEQVLQGYNYGAGIFKAVATQEEWISWIESCMGRPLSSVQRRRWCKALDPFFIDLDRVTMKINEGGFLIRLVERMIRVTQRRWYLDRHGALLSSGGIDRTARVLSPEDTNAYRRPRLPASLGAPTVPYVLPFHAFTYPLTPRVTRVISYRNALRISQKGLSQTWVPPHVFPPPAPLVNGKLNIGYISGDFNNHPLTHLMQSVFTFHNLDRFNVFLYATTPSDGSSYRRKLEAEAQHFVDVSLWSAELIVGRILQDGIHVLINLGGYTKGSRNEIFSLRPCPVQMTYMGFAGTLAAGWCDYLLSDTIACPPGTSAIARWRAREGGGGRNSRAQAPSTHWDRESDLDWAIDPESPSEEWMYTEKVIYMPQTCFVTDHKQSFQDDVKPGDMTWDPDSVWRMEEKRRFILRKAIFPDLPDDSIIFANFNQLYKVDPEIFVVWLRILQQLPNSILWLLRFPAAGEANLLETARAWAGAEVASRVRFTDIARKEVHVQRSRVADLFLDTVECNAHTIAADVLWSGTPVLTWPKHRLKMCSRMGASIAYATGFGEQMVADSLTEYESRALSLAHGVSYSFVPDGSGGLERRGTGELMQLRRNLYLNRDSMPLFDTRRWTRNVERAYEETWRRWVMGVDCDASDEWEQNESVGEDPGHIYIVEDDTRHSSVTT